MLISICILYVLFVSLIIVLIHVDSKADFDIELNRSKLQILEQVIRDDRDNTRAAVFALEQHLNIELLRNIDPSYIVRLKGKK